jgi:hypothetical protein
VEAALQTVAYVSVAIAAEIAAEVAAADRKGFTTCAGG